jgi:hypothetical protein
MPSGTAARLVVDEALQLLNDDDEADEEIVPGSTISLRHASE